MGSQPGGDAASRSSKSAWAVTALVLVAALAPPLAMLRADERDGDLLGLTAVVFVLWAATGVLVVLTWRADHLTGTVLALIVAVVAVYAAANPTVNSDGLGSLLVV